ncbi:efflux RND transporter periplasmic adaptor subunit [Jeotgalibacillus aurantiacus]|uniref:hypothetical protein n=1 Tax=Jeotgalibacillus aurantiacus TaxID=2763266 RepID=UPI001D0A10F6|nr:hypothetical protein [Jeotgalibacillus aurantiacus]
MKKRMKWIGLSALIVLFAGINLYLIKHDMELIDRASIVYDQKPSKSEDVETVLMKNGVIESSVEERVYFSEQLGMFTRFLVEIGDQVTTGTPLYEYTVSDLEEQRLIFESEIEQLESEIDAVEDYITELESIERQLDDAKSTSTATARPAGSLSGDDEELLINIEIEFDLGIDISNATIEQTSALLEQKIGEQESQITRLEAERDKFQRLTDGLEDSPVVTVESEYTGTVAKLAEDISSPLITIYTDNLASKVLLTDDEAKLVKADMNARITSPVAEEQVNGMVTSNPLLPEQDPALTEKSFYPVNIGLLTATEDWFIGQHVVNEIVLESSPGAVTVPVNSLDESRLHVLNAGGYVEPRLIETGILDGDRQQIASNLETGEWLVVDTEQTERFYQPYMTPMTFERMNFDNLTYTDSRTNWKFVLLGVLPN